MRLCHAAAFFILEARYHSQPCTFGALGLAREALNDWPSCSIVAVDASASSLEGKPFHFDMLNDMLISNTVTKHTATLEVRQDSIIRLVDSAAIIRV